MRVIIYADGGCEPNPGPGGWGVVISGPDGVVDLCGGEPGTTNNRMELTAAIRALEHFPEGAQIEMRCDSQYVVKSVTEWMRGWKAKGWRTTTGAVKNVDLMQRLDELASRRNVKWIWVRGHAGDPLNERADRLATKGRVEARLKPKSAVAQSPSPVGTTTAAKTLPAVPVALLTVTFDAAVSARVATMAAAANLSPESFVEAYLRHGLETNAARVASGAARPRDADLEEIDFGSLVIPPIDCR